MRHEQEPLPEPDADTIEYWEAANRGEYVIPYCEACEQYFFYPRRYCPSCTSERVTFRNASGRGSVYSFSVVHRAPIPAFEGRVPYTVGLVELDEGPRVYARIEPGSEQVQIGSPVEVRFERKSDEISLPYFEVKPGR